MSGQLNGVVKLQQIAEIHTFGNTTLGTHPVQSDLKHAVVPTTPKMLIPAQVYANRNDAESGPVASASRKRPSMHGRLPRALLGSVQLTSRNIAPRPSKHHIDAGETEATPKFPPHSLRRHRDTETPVMAIIIYLPFSRTWRVSRPTSCLLPLPFILSYHPCVHLRLVGGSISVKEDQTRRSLLADPIAKSTDEEMVFEKTGLAV
jgi:hypothetical protein